MPRATPWSAESARSRYADKRTGTSTGSRDTDLNAADSPQMGSDEAPTTALRLRAMALSFMAVGSLV